MNEQTKLLLIRYNDRIDVTMSKNVLKQIYNEVFAMTELNDCYDFKTEYQIKVDKQLMNLLYKISDKLERIENHE